MEELKNEGNTFFKEKEYDKANEKYLEALKLAEESDVDKDIAILNSNISATYCKLDNFEAALEHAVVSTKKNPDWHKSWYRLAFVLHNLDKKEQALTAIEKSLECCEKEDIKQSYVTELKNKISGEEYKIIDNEKEEKSNIPNMGMPDMANMGNMANMGMPDMGNMANMGNMAKMMEQMMGNSSIKSKLDNPAFKNKMMNNQGNPMAMMSDPDMQEIMAEMMKSINI